jgi:tetratricopeptide (TPR) repeat protein
MRTPRLLVLAAAAGVFVGPSPAADPQPAPRLGDLGKVGTVEFPTSCDPSVQPEFNRALALLHSFFYEEARRVFTEVAGRDPDCAMAYWGVAMTYYHPIWTAPDKSEFEAGLAAVEKALAAPKQGERESEFIRALAAYYKAVDVAEGRSEEAAPSCHGPARLDHSGRAACYLRELEGLANRRPQDVEAAAFYALQLVATSPPGDPALGQPRKAGEILEKWFGKRPDHPGLAHYLIHSYDYPPLAARGLPAAQAYAAIAPGVPHALHMPSHIFTRLGMWKGTIASNLASAEAARQYAARYHPDAASFEELHALDYLVYGYLQTAQDRKAKQVLDRLREIRKTHPQTDFVVAYAFGAIPARYALERREWKEAASLSRTPMPFWDKFPFAEGHVAFARAVGAAHLGKVDAARAAAERLRELAGAAMDPRFRYFADQMEIQRQAALGLIALAAGKKEEAVGILREAAGREDALGKHPVSPGAMLPVRELLAEALLEAGKPTEALEQYEASLAIYPGRFNGLYGAGLAAERAGKEELTRKHYGQLLDMTKEGDGLRPELARARAHLEKS